MGEPEASFRFYSNQCLEYLTLALRKAELDIADDDFRRFYEAPQAEDSSSSSSEFETSLSCEDSITAAEDDKELTTSDENTPKRRENRRTKSPIQSKEKETLIRQLGKPQMTEILLSKDIDLGRERILEVPSALLSKEQRLSDPRTICQSYYDLALDMTEHKKTTIVILLRSGRFAGAAFSGNKTLHHTTSTRYTIRRGQGKAQSSQDQKRRPKSVGSQLRRAGEEALRKDVTKALQDWREHVNNSSLILFSCPKSMLKDFFDDNADLIPRSDARVRKIPLDFSRPTYEATLAIYQVLLTVHLCNRSLITNSEQDKEDSAPIEVSTVVEEIKSISAGTLTQEKNLHDDLIPLTPLHKFAAEGNLSELVQVIDSCKNETSANAIDFDIDQRAGPDFMTPLHYAADFSTVDPTVSAACVTALLIDGHANPSVIDARHRPAYFLSSHDRVRDAFRIARATLGESYCDWDGLAKVGPPLTMGSLQAKKDKAAEKKRRQRARQKEKKAREREEAAKSKLEEAKEQIEEKEQESVKDFKGCDFCHQRLKRRARTFERLNYKYCSTECVQNHKRELMANAALARFGP